MMLAAIGFLLIGIGFLSRLFTLSIFRRISASPSRTVEPSFLPGTPWITVGSDRAALQVIVVMTYSVVLLGMALVLIGVLA